MTQVVAELSDGPRQCLGSIELADEFVPTTICDRMNSSSRNGFPTFGRMTRSSETQGFSFDTPSY